MSVKAEMTRKSGKGKICLLSLKQSRQPSETWRVALAGREGEAVPMHAQGARLVSRVVNCRACPDSSATHRAISWIAGPDG